MAFMLFGKSYAGILPLLNRTYLFTAEVYDFACVNAYDYHERRFTFKVED